MPSNNVFQYSKIRTRKRSAKKSIKTGKKNGIQLFLESGIHCAWIRNPVPGIRNPEHGIQNPRLSWIPLHGAIVMLRSNGKGLISFHHSYFHPFRSEESWSRQFYWYYWKGPTHFDLHCIIIYLNKKDEFSASDAGGLEDNIRVLLITVEPMTLWILVRMLYPWATKLGSCDNNPAYC